MLNTNELVFQGLDWCAYNEQDNNGIDRFCAKLFGMTINKESICVIIKNYKPYFYVEIPDEWSNNEIKILIDALKIIINRSRKMQEEHVVECLEKYELIEAHKFYGFTNNKNFKYIKLTFSNINSFKRFESKFNYQITVNGLIRDHKFQLCESNLEPILRIMHIQNISPNGIIKVDKTKCKEILGKEKQTYCVIEIETDYTNLKPVNENIMIPFIVCSFDIECYSDTGMMPSAKREKDVVTEIGMSISRGFEDEPYYKYIAILGQADKAILQENNIDFECFGNERDLLLGWRNKFLEINPDIITGWNVFGFDWKYLHIRSEKLGISPLFEKLSKVIELKCVFDKKKLESSAYGKNIMYYYKNMEGRVIFDLMKVFQREQKLESYKLDFVSSTYVRDDVKILEYTNSNNTDFTLIYTTSIYGVYKDQYISIYYNDGLSENKHMNGKKYKILELTKSNKTIDIKGNLKQLFYIKVEGKIDDDIMKHKNYKIYWCEVKDDVSPKDLFNIHKNGNPKDIAIVAKYCVMDCILCTKLMAKMQILINNIGMANVCCVPLSYIFLRGQGIKIFSLISRKCRELNFIINTQRKPKSNEQKNNDDSSSDDEKIENPEEEKPKVVKHRPKILDPEVNENLIGLEDESETTYEGAYVLSPTAGVYYEPIPVLDYSSLYPSSMIMNKISHNCLVIDPQYDNLKGFIYHTITYNTKDNNGEFTIPHTCKFAESLDGKYPCILPEILSGLLAARKKVKKEMENEKDTFKKKILDGYQIAYKITANSLYGQTGASTSAVYLRDVAGSTPATGREMLLYAKNFVEKIFPLLVNCIVKNAKQKYEEYMSNYLDVTLKLLQGTYIIKDLKNYEEGYKVYKTKVENAIKNNFVVKKYLVVKKLDIKTMKNEDLERKFKDPDDPLRIVIVCDMWLTGFDVECLSTIYLKIGCNNLSFARSVKFRNSNNFNKIYLFNSIKFFLFDY